MTDDRGDGIVHVQPDTGNESPGVEIAEAVAGLEGKEPAELDPTWDCIDDGVGEVFSTPPPEAPVEIAFSYEGYRVTVEQTGLAKLVRTG